MPKKAKPPDLNRKWEKNRRDRIKEKFNLLAKALPCYDPSVTLCHEFILENARITIEEQRKEIDKILTNKSENVQEFKDEKIKKLQNRIKKLLFRNEQLSFILKDVGIPLPTYVGSGRIKKSHNKVETEESFQKKFNKEKENYVSKLVQKKKKAKAASTKRNIPCNKKLDDKKKSINENSLTTSSSNCLLMLSQQTAVKTNISPYYLLTSNTIDKPTASKIVGNETKSISCLNVNTQLSNFGSGTLLFANGTIMPVISQPQIMIPTPNPIVTLQKTFPNFTAITKSTTNVTVTSQSHVTTTLQSLVLSTSAGPVLTTTKTTIPVTSNEIVNIQKRISENLKKFPKVVPKRCLTKTTQVNKVPIPALTSKYANNYVLLTESNVIKTDSLTKDKKVGKGTKRKIEENKKTCGKKAKLETSNSSNVTKSNDTLTKSNEGTSSKDNPILNKPLDEDKSDKNPNELKSTKPEISSSEQSNVNSKLVNTSSEQKDESGNTESLVQETTSDKEELNNKSIKEADNAKKVATSTSTVVNSSEEIKNIELNLVHSELSNDIFASLQVPPGCQNPDSTSPTAAFLLAFPLVSSVKVSEVMEEENLESQSSTPTLLQIGTMDNNKTSQNDNLLSLDNFTLFSSKNVCGEYYGNFGLSNEAGKNVEDKDLSVKSSENENLKNNSHVNATNNIDQSRDHYTKNKDTLLDNILKMQTIEKPDSTRDSSQNKSNEITTTKENINSSESRNLWASEGYKQQEVQQTLTENEGTLKSNHYHIQNENASESNVINIGKEQSKTISSEKENSNKDQNSCKPNEILNTSQESKSENWKNSQNTGINNHYKSPAGTNDRFNEIINKPNSLENLNDKQQSKQIVGKISDNEKTYDVCTECNEKNNSNTIIDNKTKICDIWNIKDSSSVSNISNINGVNIDYNNQLSSNASNSTQKLTTDSNNDCNKQRNNPNIISDTVYNIPVSNEIQKQIWPGKAAENVKKLSSYHTIENNMNNIWGASQNKQNYYKHNNSELMQCDSLNTKNSDKTSTLLTNKAGSLSQNSGKNSSVWSANDYVQEINSHNKQLSNIQQKNQSNYGNTVAMNTQNSQNINNRTQTLVPQKDQHQKLDQQQNHHNHQSQQSTHQIQQKQHMNSLAHCNNFNLYQNPHMPTNTASQHTNSLKTSGNFWSSDPSYIKQNDNQFSTFNIVKNNQYENTRYIPHELTKSDNNISKYQNIHAWNNDLNNSYQYLPENPVQESRQSNTIQTNSIPSGDKNIMVNQKQNTNIWQTNFSQGVMPYNVHQDNKISQNGNEKQNISSLWPLNQNQDVSNSYTNQHNVNMQYSPQENSLTNLSNNKNHITSSNYGMHQRTSNENKHLWSIDPISFNNQYNLEFEKSKDHQNATVKNDKNKNGGWNAYSKKIGTNVNENIKHNNDFTQSTPKNNDNNSYNIYQDKNLVSTVANDPFVNNCIKTKETGCEKTSDHDNFNVFLAPAKEVLQNPNNNHEIKSNNSTNKNNDTTHYVSKDVIRSNNKNSNNNVKMVERVQSKSVQNSNERDDQNQKSLENNNPCYFSTSYPNSTCNFNYKGNFNRNYPNPVYTTSNSCTYSYPESSFTQTCYKSTTAKGDSKYYGLNYDNYQDHTKFYSNNFQNDKKDTVNNKNPKNSNAPNKPINWMTSTETKLHSTECYLPTFSSQSYSFTSCATTEPSEMPETNKKTVEFSNDQEKQFSWSPTKFPNFLDASHNFITPTLPTLAGDLALTSLNDQKTDYNKFGKDQRRTSAGCGDQSVNFFSVSQLVDHNKSETAPPRTVTRRNSGSRSKNVSSKRNKSPKHDTTTDKTNQNKLNNNFNQQHDVFYEHKSRNPTKNISNNYSAEALIGNQGSEAANKKCELPVNKSFGSSFLTENIITYFPTVEENYSVPSQNVTSFTHNNFPNTTYSTNSFIYTASTIASSYLPNSFEANVHDYSSENLNVVQGISKEKGCNKNYRQHNGKDEKQNNCNNNSSKRVKKKQSEVSNTTNFASFDYPFLSVPGSTNSPILPEDFHLHASFLPPSATSYPCKTTLYQKQSNDFNPNSLLPLPSLPKTGVQHPEISPSINSVGTSFTNFNLSTIFPEINKGTTTNVYRDIKESTNAGSLQVPFSAEPKYTFTS